MLNYEELNKNYAVLNVGYVRCKKRVREMYY
jgi:hypothetical protein